jgi:hypothetical protein
MARQDFDLSSRSVTIAAGARRAITTGMEHTPTSSTGTGWERTPWRTTQRAAWEALVANSEAIAIKAARASAAAAGRSLFNAIRMSLLILARAGVRSLRGL